MSGRLNEPTGEAVAGREGEGWRMGRALLAAAVLALAACGLDVWPYLDPPGEPVEALPGSPFFQVINQATVVFEFRGFELYYKFFSSDQSTEQTNQSSLGTREALVAAGFHRMCAQGSLVGQTLPLIAVDPLDRNTDFMTELDFSIVETDAPSADYQGIASRTIPIRRSVTDTYGETKTFKQTELVPSDADLTAVTWPGSGQSLNLVVYALSYGLKDLSTPLYSDAQYLGYMSYYY